MPLVSAGRGARRRVEPVEIAARVELGARRACSGGIVTGVPPPEAGRVRAGPSSPLPSMSFAMRSREPDEGRAAPALPTILMFRAGDHGG